MAHAFVTLQLPADPNASIVARRIRGRFTAAPRVGTLVGLVEPSRRTPQRPAQGIDRTQAAVPDPGRKGIRELDDADSVMDLDSSAKAGPRPARHKVDGVAEGGELPGQGEAPHVAPSQAGQIVGKHQDGETRSIRAHVA